MENQEKKNKPTKSKKSQLNNERELARFYYFNGETQKAIAERIGVSAVTVNRWVKEGNWDGLRAAKTISRRELVSKMLGKINDRLDEEDWTPDELAKAASAIEKLDKQTNTVTVIEVMTAFNKWLLGRAQFDTELTPEIVQAINKYQDLYISEILNSTKIEQ